jgi:chromosome segregation ATPase
VYVVFISRRLANSRAPALMQVIVISLKDTFYEKADALVGIYRDAASSCSRTASLNLQSFDDPVEGEE